MDVAVKICGLTRPQDAAFAAEAGASFLGVIFAESPRRLQPSRARAVLDAGGPLVRRVGVFGRGPLSEILMIAHETRLDAIQLHSDPTVAEVTAAREAFGGKVWAVIRTLDGVISPELQEMFTVADAVVIDAKSEKQLGGTGLTVDWTRLATELRAIRHSTPVVLAGGLTAENVGEAVRKVRPAVVDVSSGVESAPGIKDRDRMKAFTEAVQKYQVTSV
jgi:phosphoribosylanthranilate isomerase